jgi:hypothetical protein
MKKAILLSLSFMLITSSVWACLSRQAINLDLGNQEITVVKNSYRSEERMMILADDKCQRSDRCYRGRPMEGLVRIRQISDNITATYFYEVDGRAIDWNMVIFQEEQKNGVVDVVIDRISEGHAIAWSGFQPFACDHHSSPETPALNINEIESILNTSIHAIDSLVYFPRDLNQLITGFKSALSVEEIILDQVKTSNTDMMTVAATIYSVHGVEDTVYGYTANDPRFDESLTMVANDNLPGKFKHYPRKKANYEMRSAAKMGISLFSSAWFNLKVKNSECYTLDTQIVTDLLN